MAALAFGSTNPANPANPAFRTTSTTGLDNLRPEFWEKGGFHACN